MLAIGLAACLSILLVLYITGIFERFTIIDQVVQGANDLANTVVDTINDCTGAGNRINQALNKFRKAVDKSPDMDQVKNNLSQGLDKLGDCEIGVTGTRQQINVLQGLLTDDNAGVNNVVNKINNIITPFEDVL